MDCTGMAQGGDQRALVNTAMNHWVSKNVREVPE
jgi:hypothetical protein